MAERWRGGGRRRWRRRWWCGGWWRGWRRGWLDDRRRLHRRYGSRGRQKRCLLPGDAAAAAAASVSCSTTGGESSSGGGGGGGAAYGAGGGSRGGGDWLLAAVLRMELGKPCVARRPFAASAMVSPSIEFARRLTAADGLTAGVRVGWAFAHGGHGRQHQSRGRLPKGFRATILSCGDASVCARLIHARHTLSLSSLAPSVTRSLKTPAWRRALRERLMESTRSRSHMRHKTQHTHRRHPKILSE